MMQNVKFNQEIKGLGYDIVSGFDNSIKILKRVYRE